MRPDEALPSETSSAHSLALTPRGHLTLTALREGDVAVEGRASARIARAFAVSTGAGLLHLGAVEVSTHLPPPFAFWRDFARTFVTALCSAGDLEAQRAKVDVQPRPDDLEHLAANAPPMEGGEYLTAAVLESLWGATLDAFREQLRSHDGTVQALLASYAPAWNVVGRVHFHLAENKQDEARPFAFLATFSTGLTASGMPRHRPLGEAVSESSSAKDKQRLLALLSPVQKAASRSTLTAELVSSGQVFEPQAWTAADAHRFLKDVPALEESGVVVRVPDWWKARRRPQVSVSIGSREPSGLGLDALLDFKVHLTLEGQDVSADELESLGRQTEGLVLLKGQWVEVDREKLNQVLAHWREAQRQASKGLSFAEGMRLLAGVALSEADDAPAVREWTHVDAGPWLKQTLQRLRADGGAGDAPPEALKAELRPYQRAGVRWLSLLCSLRLGACLADDMGLGKTVQVLALVLALQRRKALPGPHLFVVPASLLANWAAEAERFAPSLKLLVAHPSAMASKELAALPPERVDGVDVVLTSYGTAHRLEWLGKRKWGLLVLDEAQAIKNPSIKQTVAVKALVAQARVALTGTPVENHAGDLWSLFDFLNPGLLGTAKEFGRFLKRPGAFAALRELTRPYLMRRLKTDRTVIADLPEKTEVRAYCGLSKQQAALYQKSVESLSQDLKGKDGIARRGVVLAYLLRFKQICNHPSQWLGDGDWNPDESGKHQRLRELCETIAAKQEKVLVFTQFKETTGALSRWLSAIFGRSGLVLTGETPVKARQGLVKRFQDDEALPFFVLSLKAGGTGLNLTAASHVIHFDRWWNPAVENQATDRAFRIGQKRNVLVHKLVCQGTVEERIDALIESKQGLARELLEGGAEVKLTELDDEALLRMVSLDLHRAMGAQ